MSSTVTRTSNCLCGAVNITFTGTDKGAVLCHCSNCKASSGSAFMHNHRLTKADIKVNKGLDCLRRYADGDTKSGATLYRHFCSNCVCTAHENILDDAEVRLIVLQGCPLYLENNKLKGFVVMNSGNMKEGRQQPTMELFQEEKYSWIGQVVPTKGEAKL